MLRAEIWWAELPAPAGPRPVVLLSRNRSIQVRESVTVAQITSVIRDIPVEVRLSREDGLPKDCVINCDVVQTIPRSLLRRRIAVLSPAKKGELDSALRFSQELE